MYTKTKILQDRYLSDGETENDMYRRVARTAAQGDDRKEREYFYVMTNLYFLPNSPTLVNLGKNTGTSSACFGFEIEDSRPGIMKALDHQAAIHHAFGGSGFWLGNIRPRGDLISSTGGKACGPCEVIKTLNQNSSMIRQGGRREGGNMGILPITHPDIEEFITLKEKGSIWEKLLSHFNLSVGITDSFMEAVHEDEGWWLTYEGQQRKRVPAKYLYDLIIHHMHDSGDPGVVFLDTIQRGNTTPHLGVLRLTNPCGEQPLLNYEACNLGSIDISKFVVPMENNQFTIDYERLKDVIHIAVNFLDDIIDVNYYPLPEVEEAVRKTRKIGLGIMGLHDMLIKMGISYSSEEGRELAATVMRFINTEAIKASHTISEEKGVFPAWSGSKWDEQNVFLRNAVLTTIAPTGSLSIIAECSPGIEPVPFWKKERKIESGTFVEVHPTYELAKEKGLLESSLDITPEEHILMQSALQEHVHNAVSKTINVRNEVTEEELNDLLWKAFKGNCKGFTIYRDGSKDEQVFREIKGDDNPIIVDKPSDNSIIVRDAKVYEASSGCGTLRVVIDEEDNKLHETFVITAGGCSSNNEALGRLISMEMQANGNVEGLSKSLHKVKCINATRNPKSVGKSCADVIAKCIDIHDPVGSIQTSHSSGSSENRCPDCNEILNFGEGCGQGTCYNCGWSGCN